MPATAGRALVANRTNCEDILLNWVAAAAIWERHGAAATALPATPAAVQAQGASAGGGSGLRLDPLQLAQREAQREAAQPRWLPQALWAQPSRRLDISFLSGVGISRGRAAHEGAWPAAGLAE